MITEFDKRAMGDIVAGHGTWFTAHLLRLMAKADAENFAKLQAAFPEEAKAFLEWREGSG